MSIDVAFRHCPVPVIGAAVTGVALLANVGGQAVLLTALVTVLVFGLGLLVLVRTIASAHGGRAASGRSGIIGVAAGVALVSATVGAIAVIDTGPERYLAIPIAAGLIAVAVSEVAGAVRHRPRAARLLRACACVAGAALVMLWPRFSPGLVGAILGAALLAVALRFVFTRRSSAVEPPALASGPEVLLSAGACVAAVVLLAATVLIYRGGTHIDPGDFYRPPADVPSEAGRLLRAEPLTDGVVDGAEGWKILYTTIDGSSQPGVASGTVIAALDRPVPAPVLTIGHGTTGIVPACAPSLTASPIDGAAEATRQLIGRGWVAVTTDYVGLGTDGPHPYLVGRPEAANMLDAVRAAREIDGLTLDDRTIAMGHSQGGHAALWTGVIAPDYAPDIRLLGVAAFAPASDLRAIYTRIGDTSAGRIVTAYQVLTAARLRQSFDLDAMVRSGYRRGVESLGEHCFDGRDAVAALAAASQMSGEILTDGALDSGFGAVLDAGSVTDPIAAPVLVAQGTSDSLVVPDAQREWVRERCAAGQVIDYREFAGLEHASLVADDSPLIDQVVDWVGDRDAERPAPDQCTDVPD